MNYCAQEEQIQVHFVFLNLQYLDGLEIDQVRDRWLKILLEAGGQNIGNLQTNYSTYWKILDCSKVHIAEIQIASK